MLKLNSMFGNHMVLQAGQPLPVWGTAAAGTTVEIVFGAHHAMATADDQGRWRANLPATGVSNRPAELVVSCPTERIVLTDVLVGEVWLASGQSNMEWTLGACDPEGREIATANVPEIRFFKVGSKMSDKPLTDCCGTWVRLSPETAGALSGVGYFFARKLYRALAVPVGIISGSWGASSAEAWMSGEAIDTDASCACVRKMRDDSLRQMKKKCSAYAKEMEEWYQTNAAAVPDARQLCQEIERHWHEKTLSLEGWTAAERPFVKKLLGLSNADDAVVWFRNELNLTQKPGAGEWELDLGVIDAQIEVYFDGVKIGENNDKTPIFWLKPAVFKVPRKLLTAGRHTVAVRMLLQFCAGSPYESIRTLGLYPREGQAQPIWFADNWMFRVAGKLPKPDATKYKTYRTWNWPLVPWSMLFPAKIFNAMLAPIIPYAMKGTLWFQGESNIWMVDKYKDLLTALIRDWRRLWGQERFFFGIAQSSEIGKVAAIPGKSNVAALREAHFQVAMSVPDAGVASSIDTGEPENVHPSNKRPVGERLANWALACAYGKDVKWLGPRHVSHAVNGSTMTVQLSDAGDGLRTTDGQPPRGFCLAGKDLVYKSATARIAGKDRIELQADGIAEPVHVRYGWAENPEANLTDSIGIPAFSFRTDDRFDI